ncbi:MULTISPECIES: GtrA family protein [unclassified Pseudomonas]|uniref:GtrA family protein n=1 Tax=unclassified Pseudomonas TaxID=196821 RepID=UPI00088E4EAA|nr:MULTISPECIES: GtrA family protein [unclassified Pseudomonas]UVL58130.1 GtrA family protein [Pseudomonas sp. B21-035]SDQ83765.1 Putative flippase GtrA (transmembrane translocase of bactoprenol-linked glucose) [Pseudomonas sp. UC 17F4]
MNTCIRYQSALLRSLTRYLGVGTVATLAHQLLFLLGLSLDQPWWGSVCGACLGALLSFWLNRRYCFTHRDGKALQPLRFVCVALLHNGLNALAMWLMLDCLATHPLLAQALTTASLAVLGFFIHRHWTYHHADLAPATFGR